MTRLVALGTALVITVGVLALAGLASRYISDRTRPPPKRGVCDANAGCNRYRILLMVLPCTSVPTTAPVA